MYGTEPPYRTLAPTPARMRASAGYVLLIPIGGSHEAPALPATIGRFRIRLPSTPIVVRPDATRPVDIIAIVESAAHLRVHFMAGDSGRLESGLRDTLTNPSGLGGDVAAWLRRVRPDLPAMAGWLIDALIGPGIEAEPLAVVLRRHGIAARSARRTLRRANLPSPSRWSSLARILRGALALQRSAGEPVLRVALDNGFPDGSVLSRGLRQQFGVHADDVRKALGWGWLMDRFIARHAPATRRPTGDRPPRSPAVRSGRARPNLPSR